MSEDRGSPAGFRYRVVRDLSRPGFTDVALVRETPVGDAGSHGLLARLRHRDRQDDARVVHHRAFKPMLELSAMEAYAAQLELAAEHGNNGTLGCFVDTQETEDGTVEVTLWERWFDGSRLRCEQLAERAFDALKAPIVRVAGLNTTIPFNLALERASVPQVADIVAGVRTVVGREVAAG